MGVPTEPVAPPPPAPDGDPGEEHFRRSLSPSRASDFMTCPLLYRFRVIDRLPEPPSPAAVRGTLVHAVLERLFDAPAADRTPEAARSLLAPEWNRLNEAEPALSGLFGADGEEQAWLAGAAAMLDRYFTLEDPRRIEPASRELWVEAELASGVRLRGYIDRLDVAASGATRIVDYKTGSAPPEGFEAQALFQMRFYALVLWRARGEVPRLLQLMYLGSGEIVRYEPEESDLLATERKVNALWQAIERARAAGDWRPRPGRLCDWCAHKPICPAHGGTPPPLPQEAPAQATPSPGPEQGAPPQEALAQTAPPPVPAQAAPPQEALAQATPPPVPAQAAPPQEALAQATPPPVPGRAAPAQTAPPPAPARAAPAQPPPPPVPARAAPAQAAALPPVPG